MRDVVSVGQSSWASPIEKRPSRLAGPYAHPSAAMALSERRVLILYGSETGNSQEKAGEIDRLCQRLRFDAKLEEMDDIKLVCFCPPCFSLAYS